MRRHWVLFSVFIFCNSTCCWASTLLLKGGYAITDAVVVSMQSSQVLFTFSNEDPIYRIWGYYLEASLEAPPPENYKRVHPYDLPRYMLANLEEPGFEIDTAKIYTTHGALQNTAPIKKDYKVSKLMADKIFYLFGNLGYAGYRMSQVNKRVDRNNAAFQAFGVGKQNKIYGGLLYGGGFGFILGEYVSLGFEIASFTAESNNNNLTIGERLSLPALELGGGLTLGTAISEKFRGYSTFSLGNLSLHNARLRDYYSGLGYSDKTYNLSGSTTSYKLSTGLEYRVLPGLGLDMQAGYHWASIPEVKADYHGDTFKLVNSDRTAMAVDYSGFFIQTSLWLYF